MRLSLNLSLLVSIFTLVIVIADIIGGPLKYYTAISGLGAISNLPLLAALGFVGLYAYLRLREKYFLVSVYYSLFAIFVVYSYLTGQPLLGIFFTVYIWAPFFIGNIYAVHGRPGRMVKAIIALWALSVGGVLLNSMVTFPWHGQTVEVMGRTAEIARDWQTNGHERLPGLSRMSATVAIQICILCGLLMTLLTKWQTRIAIYVLSAFTIYLTTSKAPLLIMAAMPFAAGAYQLIKHWHTVWLKPFALTVTVILSLYVIIPPINAFIADEPFNQASVSSSNNFMQTDSYRQRVGQMWPDAFKLIRDDHRPHEWIFGRGFGGIGSAQMPDPGVAINSADNIFVYLYVTFGMLSGLFFLGILRGVKRVFDHERPLATPYMMTVFTVLGMGATSSLFEAGTSMAAFGILVGYGVKDLFQARLTEPAYQRRRHTMTTEARPTEPAYRGVYRRKRRTKRVL